MNFKSLGRLLPIAGLGIAILMVAYMASVKPEPPAPKIVQVGSPPDVQTTIHASSLHAGEHISILPEDGSQWQTIIVYDGSPISQALIREWNATPRLRQLASQTKFYQYTERDVWVQQYRRGFPLPIVMVQRPHDPSMLSGGSNNYERVYEVRGAAVPASGEQMADDIETMIYRSIARRPCPQPQPTPGPQPQPPVPQTVPMLTPDETEEHEPEQEGIPWYVVAIPIVSALGGAMLNLKRSY